RVSGGRCHRRQAPAPCRPRPADRRGRATGRFRRPLRHPAGDRPRGRPDLDPRRWPGARARRRSACTTEPTGHRLVRSRRQRHGRGLMVRRACDGPGLLGAFRAAVASLEASVDEINALNVFPVPDGDTGTNMVATVRAALAEAEAVGPGGTAERIAAAAAFGALMGARGNSGVITSQVLRGIAEGLAGKTRFNALDLANALDQGTKAAYGAVAKPVEGTILTVIREASAAAVEAAEHERTIDAVMGATTAAAQKAVARTPTLLAILREAGVVDSGGQGLFRLFEGAYAYLTGEVKVSARLRGAVGVGAGPPGAATSATEAAHGAPPGAGMRDEGFGFETMFLARAEPDRPLDIDAIRTYYESIGESVLVAGDARAIEVHIHHERPDQVLA